MSFKKWIVTFSAAVLAVCAAIMCFNVCVDPFGVFGDRFSDDYGYNMTMNPRISKIEYLKKHHSEYDSYIIGCSKTSCYSVDKLNEYCGASFFNMLMYGGDMYDIEKTAEYIIKTYEPKNIVINIGLEETTEYNTEPDPIKQNLHPLTDGKPLLPFYFKYASLNPQYSIDKLKNIKSRDFLMTGENIFVPETGAYNKQLRDISPIGTASEYASANEAEFENGEFTEQMQNTDKCVAGVKKILDMCREHSIDFKLIVSPVYEGELKHYPKDGLVDFFVKLAEVTDFYSFAGYTSAVTNDKRYYYDTYHFRNCVGDMALAYIFGDESRYVPEGFGKYVTSDNAAEYANDAFSYKYFETEETELPVLLYHNIAEEPQSGMDVTSKKFEGDIGYLLSNGYTPVSLADIESYVFGGTDLPDKPVLITFDDGYMSNYEYAYPILKKYNCKAVVFPVGISFGKDKLNGVEILRHFGFDEANEMISSGLVEMGSHTYDMHQTPSTSGRPRLGAINFENETDKAFAKVFVSDALKYEEEISSRLVKSSPALSYPYGNHNTVSDVCARELNFKITFTTDEGTNTLVKGTEQTLYNLKRFGISENDDISQILN